MLARVDVFGTVDGQFATLAKRAAAALAEAGHRVELVVGTDEFVRYLEGL